MRLPTLLHCCRFFPGKSFKENPEAPGPSTKSSILRSWHRVLALFFAASILTGPAAETREKPGPSSRRTGLVITEIMYHPIDRTDARNLEFVELYNSQEFGEDIGGFRFSGDINYLFPSNTVIAARQYLVIAKSPADLNAVYGLSTALGPFTNNLSNSAGSVRLRNRSGAVLLDLSYDSENPWPASPDGAGHSLTLTQPSYGERDRRAWGASRKIGGSPGKEDAPELTPFLQLKINEVLAHTDLPALDFVELYNSGSGALILTGCVITDDPGTNKYVFPAGSFILAGSHLALTEEQLGFRLDAAGETIYLKSADGTFFIDAVRFPAQENGVSFGRSPDGSESWGQLAGGSAGKKNGLFKRPEVVISEIMYHPITGGNDAQYVEIYNRTSSELSLAGWGLEGGIGFRFPEGAKIGAQSYAVVAAKTSTILSNYPGLAASQVHGDFSGKLSGKSERIVLTKPDLIIKPGIETNRIDIGIDEVTYQSGGQWGRWSDGGGSSLELVDFESNPRLGPSWADSDESVKAPWTAIEFTGVLDQGRDTANWLHLLLLGEGECLVDNVEVLRNGVNLLSNPNFELGTAGWFFQGTHQQTTIENGTGIGGSRSLRVRASGRGDTGANRIRGTLTSSPIEGQTVTIRAQVRWLKGHPELLPRLRGGWLEAASPMTLPKNTGTPGKQNSRFAANAGPSIYEVSHLPVLPSTIQAVTVKARAEDPDGMKNLTLNYRLDTSTVLTAVQMNDEGRDGDAVAGDGYFSGIIPARSGLVAFHIVGTDAANIAQRFPSALPAQECYIRFGDVRPAGNFGTYRIWMPQGTVTNWSNREKNSNDPLGVTFVYNDERVVYDAESLYSGSPWHTPGYNSPVGSTCDYVLRVPKDEEFLGDTDLVLATVGNLGSDNTAQREQFAYHMAREVGVPSLHRRFINVIVNGLKRSFIYEDTQQPGSDLLDQWFPDDPDGELYKVEDWFEFDTTGDNKSFNQDATLENFTTTGGIKKTARYRWTWRKRAVKESANDYDELFRLVDALNSPTPEPYTSAVENMVDVDEWMRVFAVEHFVGNWDSYGFSRGKNMYAYKPENGKWALIPWDVDFIFDSGGNPSNDSLFAGINDPVMSRMLNHAPFRRAYFQAYQELIDGPLKTATMNFIMDGKRAALAANGVPNVTSPASTKTYIEQRISYVRTQLNSVNAPFSITSNGGNPISTNRNLIALTGTAPVEVKTILVNNQPYPLTWNTVNSWTILVPLPPGRTNLVLTALNSRSNSLPGVTATIAATFNGTPDSPAGNIVINELMYDPLVPETGYLELFNRSQTTTFDLGSYRLNGLDFVFPSGTILQPGKYLVVVENRSAFVGNYKGNATIAGEFSGRFDKGGETLTLVKPGRVAAEDLVVSQVTYDDDLPWPPTASGTASSLQLIDPAQPVDRVANWAVMGAESPTNAPPPPTWQYVTASGTASSSRLYIYLEAVGDVHIDDLKIVAGSVPDVGANVVIDGGFEAGWPGGWTVSANHSQSGTTTAQKRSGARSLRIVASVGGTTRDSSIWRDLTMTLNAAYTLSFWYLPSTNGAKLTMRLSGNGITVSQETKPDAATTSNQFTPGFENSTKSLLDPIPLITINEIEPYNLSGILDNKGEKEPWLELYNADAAPLDISGYHLSTNASNLQGWSFPAGTTIPARGFFLVWLDGESAESVAGNLHSGIRTAPSSGSVLLSQTLGTSTRVLDFWNYQLIQPDRSYGFFPDGKIAPRQMFYQATPGRANDPSPQQVSVKINEWMASNNQTIADQDGKFQDWFELYNPSDSPADLSGFYLSDTPLNKTMSRLPDGTIVPAKGYLLVWADEEPGQNSITNMDRHADFKLNKDQGFISLVSKDLNPVDSVTYGAQTNDVSQGRHPDGSNVIKFMRTPSPRSANKADGESQPPVPAEFSAVTWAESGKIGFSWKSKAGETYVIQYKEDLGASDWLELRRITGTGTTTSIQTEISAAKQRFYRLISLPN